MVKVLWDSLLEYDDLTASTQSVMSLLSEVIKAVPNKSTVLVLQMKLTVLLYLAFVFFFVLTRFLTFLKYTLFLRLGANTENLASRLSPFFVHVDEKVRRAAVNTYSTVLEVEIYKVVV